MKNHQGEHLAVMANTVAEARHSLTVPEQRLMLWLVAQIEREDQAFQEHTISVPEMAAVLGNNNGRLYEQMEAMCDRLQSRVLEICYPNEKERTKHNWLHSIRYHDGEGRITLRIHDLLAPVFLELKTRFCKVPLKAVFHLRGGYAIRWLERLTARLPLGPWEMSVAELREWLHVAEDELVATGHLVSRAIDYPRKELEAKTEVSFDYETLRRGKRVVGWIFTPRANRPARPAKRLPIAGLGVSRGRVRKARQAAAAKTLSPETSAPQAPAPGAAEPAPELEVRLPTDEPDPVVAVAARLRIHRRSLRRCKDISSPDAISIAWWTERVAQTRARLQDLDPSHAALMEDDPA